MSDMLKFLGSELNRIYSAVVGKPMSWRMIDALVSIEEASEKPKQDEAGKREGDPLHNGEDVNEPRK